MIDEEIFWEVIGESSTINKLNSYDHGPAHWRRVSDNAVDLAMLTPGADEYVVRLFALFHDAMRENEWNDPEHGKRGWLLAKGLGVEEALTPAQRHVFGLAVIRHDFGETESDPTIGCCWDADRLDLGRVGIIPDPMFFSTVEGRRRAQILRAEALKGVR